jgi:hypothetical protein
MRIISLAIVTTLFAGGSSGCALDADEPGTSGLPPAAPEATIVDPETGERFIDARAVAASQEVITDSDIGPVALTSLYSGTLAAGAVQQWTYNNASLTQAYHLALSPVGASTSAMCQFEVIRQWDVRRNNGEREFKWQIKNIGSIACATTIYLEGQPRYAAYSTGGLDAGASKNFTYNNANPHDSVWFVNVTPSGATSTNTCQMEVTRLAYNRKSSDERELLYTVKNIGAIACQGEIQLGRTTNVSTSWSTGVIYAGASKTSGRNNVNPLDRVFAVGVLPQKLSVLDCTMEVDRSYYRQRLNAGVPERELMVITKNLGIYSCDATLLLNYLD